MDSREIIVVQQNKYQTKQYPKSFLLLFFLQSGEFIFLQNRHQTDLQNEVHQITWGKNRNFQPYSSQISKRIQRTPSYRNGIFLSSSQANVLFIRLSTIPVYKVTSQLLNTSQEYMCNLHAVSLEKQIPEILLTVTLARSARFRLMWAPLPALYLLSSCNSES